MYVVYLPSDPFLCVIDDTHTGCPKRKCHFWGKVIVSVIISKKVYMYMCPIPKRFRDRAISLYSSKVVDKKEILSTVSDPDIYCSRQSLESETVKYGHESYGTRTRK
jgi:hypothetical protein